MFQRWTTDRHSSCLIFQNVRDAHLKICNPCRLLWVVQLESQAIGYGLSQASKNCVVGNIKKWVQVIADKSPVGWLARQLLAMACMFSSHGDSDSQPRNLSTQLAKWSILASLQAWGPLSQLRLSSTSDFVSPPPESVPGLPYTGHLPSDSVG